MSFLLLKGVKPNFTLKKLLFFSFIFFVLQFQSSNIVSALKCWTCQSSNDPKCADPFDDLILPIVDCNGYSPNESNNRPMICTKIRQKVFGEWRTQRKCSVMDETFKEGQCLVRHANDIYMEVCSCKSKDGCNSSISLDSNLVLITMSFVLSLFCHFTAL